MSHASEEEFGKDSDPLIEFPKKALYRQRAHCNPLSDSYIAYPASPRFVNWSKRYPRDGQEDTFLQFNTRDYPEDYSIVSGISRLFGVKTATESDDYPKVTILDIGCGYGGLLIYLSKLYPKELSLGMEIRDKVTNFVGKRILSLRKQHPGEYLNVSVVRTNSMKFLPNYVSKSQLGKMFFCFPDPHFKKSNWRRRIINYSLLSLYAYVMKSGGRLYIVTDVYELFVWMKNALDEHPLFVSLGKSEMEKDECYRNFDTVTEEGIKNAKNETETFKHVYYRI
ncbi:tRNA guanine-n-7-methyltransferase, putative [Theileria equi strain WA]|uniref:tRNA (guanine-N(7)-)-methyltransferase n=1 Tax=Theileria equi strain WA TaxID=1537102 RepID=L0AZ81_THEEQ|nr:tRNA guanine-n-7-methyltransferase, putative [Theileria equi strain WA]AFZ80214.1 tRNA guanine-n-7-methyltransferase, putative [Theileria equi strain WA]|eukprot:XP_004829880.1 tRNA guanine-n-7-methyltransferase, putative [Theileria equi strain WA]